MKDKSDVEIVRVSPILFTGNIDRKSKELGREKRRKRGKIWSTDHTVFESRLIPCKRKSDSEAGIH